MRAVRSPRPCLRICSSVNDRLEAGVVRRGAPQRAAGELPRARSVLTDLHLARDLLLYETHTRTHTHTNAHKRMHADVTLRCYTTLLCTATLHYCTNATH
jgi:hypothetical protein